MNQDAEGVTRYKWEYKNFLEFVRQKNPNRAVIYAKALGIDRRTLVHWMSQPELREALVESIDELVRGMQEAGKKDWRMHRELLKMLGIEDESKIDVTSGGEKLTISLVEYIGEDDESDIDQKPSQDTDTVS